MARGTVPQTGFTADVIGRYTCNTLEEALASTDTSKDPEARPFDQIIIGGGSFGPVLACRLFQGDTSRAHRVLVLEAGPMLLPEHVQNLPPGMGAVFNEASGTPWNSDSPRSWNQQFPGLAFCVGGRSLFWGGWSPAFLTSELACPPWPPSVVKDLTEPVLANSQSYLEAAAEQIGTSRRNDFVYGPLHKTLQTTLLKGLKKRRPDPGMLLAGQRGTSTALDKLEDLDAPLAVDSAAPQAGLFPINKFNAVQLLLRAARLAQSEAEQSVQGDTQRQNVKKRLMIVPNTRVIRLERENGRITRIVTNQGTIDVPAHGNVFLGLGTIENTRLALHTIPENPRIGRNLMAHLRSNMTIWVPRSSFASLADIRQLEVSALFVKGIYKFTDGTKGHFHIQITASGVDTLSTDSEAELFKKIPDIDTLDRFKNVTDDWIVITLRAIGEMAGDRDSADPQNRVILDHLGPRGNFDYGQARALVRLEAAPKDALDPRGTKDLELWDAMDQASEEVAVILAGVFEQPGPIQYLSRHGIWQDLPPAREERRDTLSSTHHEGGTLWMGAEAASSVTNEWGRFWEVDNLYAVGPCLLPTLGSPNPMLSGVALARRTADYILKRSQPAPLPVEDSYTPLFDGSERTYHQWRFVGQGGYALADGELVAQPGGDMGLLYYAAKQFGNFTLRLQVKLQRPTGDNNDNAGIFVRFREPRRPVPRRDNPAIFDAYGNQAYVAVDTGYEIQIDEEARGNPDGLDEHRTGAVYNVPIGAGPGRQEYQRGPRLKAGRWHDVEIEVIDQSYTVRIDGVQVSAFEAVDTYRGKSVDSDTHSGFIGLQVYRGHVRFRNIRVLAHTAARSPAAVATTEVVESITALESGAH